MLTLDEVKSIASLAKLEFLTEQKLVKLQSQLNAILQYIDLIKEVEIGSQDIIDDLKPFNRFQSDNTNVNFDKESFINKAPKNNGKYIVTKKVL